MGTLCPFSDPGNGPCQQKVLAEYITNNLSLVCIPLEKEEEGNDK